MGNLGRMATNSPRGALLRSLPFLLLTLALTLAGVVHGASAAESTADTAALASAEAETRTPEGPVADRTRALQAQRTAGVTGSRAPPFHTA